MKEIEKDYYTLLNSLRLLLPDVERNISQNNAKLATEQITEVRTLLETLYDMLKKQSNEFIP